MFPGSGICQGPAQVASLMVGFLRPPLSPPTFPRGGHRKEQVKAAMRPGSEAQLTVP